MAKRILGSSKELKKPQLMHPAREWLIGVFVAIIIMVASAGWSVNMYLQYQDISISSDSGAQTNSVIYREGLVESALEKFAERQSKFESLVSDAPIVTLPTPEPVQATTSAESYTNATSAGSASENEVVDETESFDEDELDPPS